MDKCVQKKTKLTVSLTVSLMLSFTVLLFGPLEMYFPNSGDLWFEISMIMSRILGIFFAGFLGLAVLLFLVPDKLFKIGSCLTFGLALAFYVQASFLARNYGLLDGDDVAWDTLVGYGVFNTVIWLICILAPLFLLKLCNKSLVRSLTLGALLIVAMQSAALTQLIVTAGPKSESQNKIPVFTYDGVFELSEKENIIVFVIDAMDAGYFEVLMNQEPWYRERLKEFTYFSDMISGGARTTYGVPSMMTGKVFGREYNGDFYQYKQDAYDKVPIFKDLHEAGYDTRMLSVHNLFTEDLQEYIKNFTPNEIHPTSRLGLTGQLYKFAGCKYLPHFLKKYVWFFTEDFNDYKRLESNVFKTTSSNNFKFPKEMREQEITLGQEDKVFRLYHVFGVHGPLNMNEHGEKVPAEETSILQQGRAWFNVVFEYLDRLKELGIYDSADIIITSDHGDGFGREEILSPLNANPMFLIKPSDHDGGLAETTAPVAFTNFPATIASFFMDDYSAYGQGVFDVDEDARIDRYHVVGTNYATSYTQGKYTSASNVVEFVFGGSSKELDKITELGEIIPPNSQKYKFGTVLDFTSATRNAYPYVQDGIFPLANSGRTQGHDASMRFELTKNTKKDLRVSLDFYLVNGERHTFAVSCGGEQLTDTVLSNDDSPVEFIVPNHCIKDGAIELNFHFADAASNYDIGLSGGRIPYAFKFTSMVIDEK
ncbi:MAG: hypothetical protein FWH04_03375 [Oscillospiraceae bacterium]|nr:hypothetical protein [Oscillospiraceae bacterium]